MTTDIRYLPTIFVGPVQFLGGVTFSSMNIPGNMTIGGTFSANTLIGNTIIGNSISSANILTSTLAVSAITDSNSIKTSNLNALNINVENINASGTIDAMSIEADQLFGYVGYIGNLTAYNLHVLNNAAIDNSLQTGIVDPPLVITSTITSANYIDPKSFIINISSVSNSNVA
jgi:hypothetical protein